MKTTKIPDHNPTGRTRPKRKMGTVLRAKLSKYRARVSEFEDDAPSSTVVRWLVVLLLLHLLENVRVLLVQVAEHVVEAPDRRNEGQIGLVALHIAQTYS